MIKTVGLTHVQEYALSSILKKRPSKGNNLLLYEISGFKGGEKGDLIL
jgi:hypothetical protein